MKTKKLSKPELRDRVQLWMGIAAGLYFIGSAVAGMIVKYAVTKQP